MQPEIQRQEPSENAEENHPLIPLYSSRAIKWFSIFFTPIAGGVMTSQNLEDLGQPRVGSNALLGSIAYTIAVILFTYLTALPSRAGISFVVGYLGAFGLEFYFSYFVTNRDAFPAKSIRKPLLVCLALLAIPLALFIYAIVIGTDKSNGHFAY